MVVAPAGQPRARLSLLVIEHGQDAEDDRDAEVQTNAHQALGDGVGDVLEVHGLALDQHADGDYGVEGPRGRVVDGEGGQVRRRGAEEVAGAGGGARGLLDLGGLVHALNGNGQLPGSGNGLYDDIRGLDAALGQLCLGALD